METISNLKTKELTLANPNNQSAINEEGIDGTGFLIGGTIFVLALLIVAFNGAKHIRDGEYKREHRREKNIYITPDGGPSTENRKPHHVVGTSFIEVSQDDLAYARGLKR